MVSLEQAVAGPFVTGQLADLAARVIKVERPGAPPGITSPVANENPLTILGYHVCAGHP